MIETFIIELHHTKPLYFVDVYHGEVLETKNIDEAKKFKTYEEAQSTIKDILKEGYYISITQYFITL